MSSPRAASLRGRLTLISVASAAITLIILTAAFNIALRSALSTDLDARLKSSAQLEATSIQVSGGRITAVAESAGDTGLDSGIWIFVGRRAIERPKAPLAAQRSASALARRGGGFTDAPGELRMYANPVISNTGQQVGVVVAALSLSAYARTTSIALLGSIILGLLLLVGLAISAWLVTGGALRPVLRMTGQAEAWSEDEPDHRFGPGQRPDELGRLAHTFDLLLARVAAALRSEQRLSSEISHELRTPLARIVARSERILRTAGHNDPVREEAEAINRDCLRMASILDTLMTIARSETGAKQGRCDLREATMTATQTWQDEATENAVHLDLVTDAPVIVGVSEAVVERILGPLLENAIRHAKTLVKIAVHGGAEPCVTVEDDGGGVAEGDFESLFTPGVSIGTHSGAGLGLALARRLAVESGGELSALDSESLSGAAFRVDLPGA